MKRVALFLEDREAFTEALFAAWAEGNQVVLPGDVLPATLEALKSHVDEYIGDFPQTGGAEANPRSPRAESRGTEANLETERSGAAAASARTERVDPELDGLVVFTSGSTGAPSAIPKKLRQLFDEVKTLEATFGSRIPADARVFSTVSHQHIYGLLFSVLWPVLTNRTLTPRRLEYPEELEQHLDQHPCVLVSSPAHLKRLPDVLPFKTQLTAVFSSGGPLPEEGALKARTLLGHQPIEIFGSSETGGIAWREGTHSTWRALAGVEFRQSPEGTLELRSPHLPDVNGWLATADRIELTADTFKLLGRADRIAKIEEKRVSLELIEHTAVATGLVTEARAVVLQGARVTLGLAAVLSAAGHALERKHLLERLKTALENAVERVAIPRRFRFLDALPVNAQGKLTESALLTLFVDRPLKPDPVWTTHEPIRAVLEMTIGSTLQVLEGHFPEAAVVPGVAQLDWAINWGREAFGFTGHFVRMEVLKFQALMMPGHQVKLALDWNPERSTLTFKFTSETASYSSGRVVFAGATS
jgi:acyl-coenzyme A synthetase/AMP-(fatty) acid ligase